MAGWQPLICASDWPFLRAARIDYGPLLKLFERQLPDQGTRRAIFWDTLKFLLGLQVVAPAALRSRQRIIAFGNLWRWPFAMNPWAERAWGALRGRECPAK
jgi:hypothetical protein